MRSYWLWLLLLMATWLFAWLSLPNESAMMPWRLVVISMFFALYFYAALLRKHPYSLATVLIAASVMITIALWPHKVGEPATYTLLLYSLIAGKAIYRLPILHASFVIVTIPANLAAPWVLGYPSYPLPFAILYTAILAAGFVMYSTTKSRLQEIDVRNAALLSEYRSLKRRIASDEEAARQEERTQIARDIHDSVGHKLTALLMQLEVFRMQSGEELSPRIQELKSLAKDSLEETRSAVKSLKEQEIAGLTAILSMIRRLEAEHFMRIHFTVMHGALTAPLNTTQSFAVYRAVQEALTNIMKHSETREAAITFEAPGGSVFRFEVMNRLKNKKFVREGFGLKSMRERMKEAGGTLEVFASKDSFVIRGVIPILKERGVAE
ncbi:sensor histidine kinase [Paenibacillus sp. N1-5-1-14]|uniref:sensor histidine kinase n=1 Tax=Paenibacillus radicibacter TaxID=2972488 RepID=UPI00215938BD|nr:sensor histidine kinase [Paenibacillus radicibacter]MCR8643819.1 sensor histidine kinase [Paenibacillus radicibacter]